MFNPKLKMELDTIWTNLGTFFAKMHPDGKKVIEKYWTGLLEGLEGLYYDLYQANLATYLDSSPGYIEEGYQNYEIVFEGLGKNTEFLRPKKNLPGQHYFTLPKRGLYLSIPSLSGLNTNQVLYEGVDYEVDNFRAIKFLKPLSEYEGFTGGINAGDLTNSGIHINTNELPYRKMETFHNKSSIYLLPTLSNFLLPAFGQPNAEVLLNSGFYEPFVSGYRNDSLTYMDKRKAYAKHLTKLCQGWMNYFKKAPTLSNLEVLYSMIQGFPFVYEHGVVESIRTENELDYIAIRTVQGSISYIAAGAAWTSQTTTSVQGAYLQVGHPTGVPDTHDYSGSDTIVPTIQNFWLPIDSVEQTEDPTPVGGIVGITLTGVPMAVTRTSGWSGNAEWKRIIFNSSVFNKDSYNGTVSKDASTQGQYIYCANPTNTYTQVSGKHSPIIGYALDGYPIYGPVGYVNTDGSGGVKYLESSYLVRSGTRPTGEPSGSYDQAEYNNDYEYKQGSGDLDQFNGIFSVTPEYPKGIYHYVCTTTISGVPTYPYILPSFRGVPSYGKGLLKNKSISNLSDDVTVYEIPTGGDYLVKEGDPVQRFDILLSGITMYDYLKDPAVVSGIIRASGTIQQFDVNVIEDFDNNKGFNVGTLSESVFYTGSVLQGSDITTSDDEAQGGGSTQGGGGY